MSDLILGLADVMRAEVDSLNSIAQNSANVNTSGYKAVRMEPSSRVFSDLFQAAESNDVARPSANPQTVVNTQTGPLTVTQNMLDFALTSSAWFGVQVDDQLHLTRNGKFNINEDLYLVTTDNHIVQGHDGPILMDPSTSIEVTSRGEIYAGGEHIATFQFYEPADSRDLQPGQFGYYRAENIKPYQENPRVVQGAIENSNVDMASDMVKLMETTRHIESLQRAMTSYDSILKTGITEIGK